MKQVEHDVHQKMTHQHVVHHLKILTVQEIGQVHLVHIVQAGKLAAHVVQMKVQTLVVKQATTLMDKAIILILHVIIVIAKTLVITAVKPLTKIAISG